MQLHKPKDVQAKHTSINIQKRGGMGMYIYKTHPPYFDTFYRIQSVETQISQ